MEYNYSDADYKSLVSNGNDDSELLSDPSSTIGRSRRRMAVYSMSLYITHFHVKADTVAHKTRCNEW